ncbi:MAG: aminodeoxychorismate/anthranilate synthase component II [Planctomycetota bacterium]
MILLIDNYDSFVHNLARCFTLLGEETVVVRNDAIDAAGVRALEPTAVVISPGPCTPREAGCSVEVIRELHLTTPILGVCLGHQAIGAAFGADVIRAPGPVHGRASPVRHTGAGVFEGVGSPLRVGRYHSLVVDEATLPGELSVTARTDDGVVMAIQHRSLPIVGLQFHPESVLTDDGLRLLTNFLAPRRPPSDAPATPRAGRPEMLLPDGRRASRSAVDAWAAARHDSLTPAR